MELRKHYLQFILLFLSFCFVVAKDNAKVRFPGTMAFVLFLYFTFNELKYPSTVIMPFESIVTTKNGAVLTFVLLFVFNLLCLMVYGFAEGKQKLVKAPLLYIIVTIYAIMALAINNQQVEQNKSDDITVKIEEYFKEHGFNATVKIIPPVNNDMVNINLLKNWVQEVKSHSKTMCS